MYLFFKTRLKFMWVAISIVFTALILLSSTSYFLPGPTPMFLIEKGDLRFQTLWRTAFNFHVISACVCLAAGPFLMIPALIRFKRLHWIIGYVYINAVLWIAAPTGLIISPVSKGGWLAATGFIVTGILWWVTTWLGYVEVKNGIKNGSLQNHICWMVRSYSIALSAVWFRLIQIGLALAGMEPVAGYILSVWLSLFVSFLFSETCIARQFPNRPLPFLRFFGVIPFFVIGRVT